MAFLQVENISENDAEFGGKKIYGVSEMRLGAFSDAHSRHVCQMAIARFLDRMCLALGLHPHALHPGAIQGKEKIKFCSAA